MKAGQVIKSREEGQTKKNGHLRDYGVGVCSEGSIRVSAKKNPGGNGRPRAISWTKGASVRPLD